MIFFIQVFSQLFVTTDEWGSWVANLNAHKINFHCPVHLNKWKQKSYYVDLKLMHSVAEDSAIAL